MSMYCDEGFASEHDLYHLPHVAGPVDGCDECAEELAEEETEETEN